MQVNAPFFVCSPINFYIVSVRVIARVIIIALFLLGMIISNISNAISSLSSPAFKELAKLKRTAITWRIGNRPRQGM